MAIKTSLSIITLNVNELNAPIKRHGVGKSGPVAWDSAKCASLIPGQGTKVPQTT